MAHPYCPPTQWWCLDAPRPRNMARRPGAPGVATVPIDEQRAAKAAVHHAGGFFRESVLLTTRSEHPSGGRVQVKRHDVNAGAAPSLAWLLDEPSGTMLPVGLASARLPRAGSVMCP